MHYSSLPPKITQHPRIPGTHWPPAILGETMTDNNDITAMKRPRLLVRAARIGAQTYRREADLDRLLRRCKVTRCARLLDSLVGLEALQEARRKAGDAAYSVSAHVEVLTALLAEARLRRQKV